MSYADHDKYGMYKSSDSSGPGPALMGADTLIGDSVVNAQGEDLGDIKEIMIDTRSGRVAYAVLSFGGFLGLGEKLFAVPWQALHLDTANKRFVLNIDKDRLANAPGFDPDAWPDMSNMDWANQVNAFYGTDASMSGGSGMGSGMSPGMGSGVGAGAGSGMGAGMGSSSGMGAGASTGAGAGSSTPGAGSMGSGTSSGSGSGTQKT